MAAILESPGFTPTPVGPSLELVGAASPPPLSAQLGVSPRTLVTGIAALLVAMLIVAAGSVAVGRDTLETPPTVASAAVTEGAVVAVVAPGDTLWSIARSLQPDGDIRPLVDRLVAANGSPVIVPGQELRLPSS